VGAARPNEGVCSHPALAPHPCLCRRCIRPCSHPAGHRIVAAAAGREHSLLLTAQGEVWSFGTDSFGQCGLGFASPFVPLPVRVGGSLAGKRVASIAAGEYHSVAVTEEGDCYTFGLNRDGACATGGRHDVGSPWLVRAGEGAAVGGASSLGPVAAAAGGGGHTLLLSEDGSLWAVGKGRCGQLGRGGARAESAAAYRVLPVRVPLEAALEPVAGERGSPPLAPSETLLPAAAPLRVVSIAAGRDHSLAVVRRPVTQSGAARSAGQP
jgi:alpha-tubulin suppressor-like RCC1 family protein